MSSDTGGEVREPRPGRRSWAELLGSSLPPGLEKNILEVVLDKDKRGPFLVNEQECVKMMAKLGIDPRPGVHVEGVQICPSGKGVIFITMRKEVDLHQFCRYESFEITASGIRSTMVKPAGKRAVVVSSRGLHPNARDTAVMSYLSRFGKMVTNKVVHVVYGTGPLKGLKNGNRSYKMEIKPGENIGSYHVIDGQKVSVRYPGQQQTCGRCHNVPNLCKGGGIARECDAKGGIRVEFTDYIKELWTRIGYSPNEDQLNPTLNDVQEETEHVGEAFTPVKVPVGDGDNYAGVVITRFPKGMDHGEIMEFLCRSSLPESKQADVLIKENGKVTIKNLTSEESALLIEAIHGKNHFDRRLFCNGLIPLTPEKAEQSDTIPEIQPDPLHEQPAGHTAGASAGDSAPPVPQNSNVPALPSSSQESNSNIGNTWVTGLPNLFFETTPELVRRHSISLSNRTPPGESLAADILAKAQSSLRFQKTRIAVDELRDMTERLSDFNSCLSYSSSSGDDDESDKPKSWQTLNERKRNRKAKRKHSLTPNKDQFLKKKVIDAAH